MTTAYLAARFARAFKFFRENAGGIVGQSAVGAIALARAEVRAESMGLSVIWEDEDHAWDADCPAPPIHVWGRVHSPGDKRDTIASLGSVGLLSWSDPYVRVVKAELYQEALATLDERAETLACQQAAELASRATYVENGDEDPILRIQAAERVADGTAPAWERPADPIHWTCDGCGVEVVTDLDTGELDYRVPFKSKAHDWYHSHPFRNGEPTKEPAHVFGEDRPGITSKGDAIKVCEFCLEHCSECGTELCSHTSGDTYDGMATFPDPADEYHSVVCVDCLSKVEEEEAARVWRDCYRESERIEYIRAHRSQFDFQGMADLMGCVRGKFFAGYASELLG